jgi:glycolate oxidase iron-sulfur subunit
MVYPTAPGHPARQILNIRSTTQDGNAIELYAIHPGAGLPFCIFSDAVLSSRSETLLTLEPQILALADRCVKCGLCLPHCPTYRDSLNENESPRGRIALMQGLASQQLIQSPRLLAHLDRCLDCRNCERVCPAGVEYETLLDTTRQWLKQHAISAPNRQPQWATALLGQPQRLRRLNNLLWFYQVSGLHWLLDKTGILRLLGLDYVARLLPRLRPAARLPGTQMVARPRGRVALFTGCLGSTLEQTTIRASLTVLQRLGVAVELRPAQTCCGALAWHEGEASQALQLAHQNLQAFDPSQVDAILYTASGCGAHLEKYPTLPWATATEQEKARTFTTKLKEISTYLAEFDWPTNIQFRTRHQRIAVHEPCSQRNGLRQPDVASMLLARIPAIEVESLPGNDRCCGAAGSYMLKQPEMASRLRTEKLQHLEKLGPDLLVTTNPGCSLFMNAGLGQDAPLNVVHPVVVLADYLLPEGDEAS